MTLADLKHCGKIQDAGEELNRSLREGRMEHRHSIKSLEGIQHRSMLFIDESGCEVCRCCNDIDFVLFPTATSVGSPFTTICINGTIVDSVNHM